MPWSPHPTAGEATAMRSQHTAAREWPLLAATRESPCAGTKTPQNKKFFKKEETVQHFTQSYPFSLVTMVVKVHSVVPDSLQSTRLLYPWDSPGKNTGVDSHSLL